MAIGVIGIILPILPTTPFLLLTLVCYTNGSEKFKKWFKETFIYKNYLEPYILTKSMTNFSKVKVLFFVTVLLIIPIIIVDIIALRIVLSVVVVCHYIFFIFFVKSVSKQELSKLLLMAMENKTI